MSVDINTESHQSRSAIANESETNIADVTDVKQQSLRSETAEDHSVVVPEASNEDAEADTRAHSEYSQGRIPSEDAYEVLGEDEDEFNEPISYFQPEMSVFDMIKKRIIVPGISKITLSDEHVTAIEKFIHNDMYRLLIAYNSQHEGFNVQNTIPNYYVSHICYFLKSSNEKEMTSANFLKAVQYGSVKGSHIESLLRLMMGVYAPIIFENSSWPDSIKNDFSNTLHRFLANLTDTRWKLHGKTVLYITTEGMKIPVKDAAKNKGLVQRLETSVIHWARQIKEVLMTQDAFELSENSGLLDEILFWKNRCVDLSGITSQLEKAGVKQITQILELAKSSYVTSFLKLSGQIMDGSRQAENNLKFLNLLYDPCTRFNSAKLNDIPSLLPTILTIIRIIWVNSEFFNTRERLTGIFKKLSNEIIHRCCEEIDLDKIFGGFVVSGTKVLKECIHCCNSWKDTYDQISRIHHKCSPVPWLLDQGAIFAQVDAFIQRCKDMLQVCESQTHFARFVDGYQSVMPKFAGVKGAEVVRGLLEIEAHFERSISHLLSYKRVILDVKATLWHDCYNRFQTEMKDLELMIQSIIFTAFDTVTTVTGGIELIEIFCHLSSRELIRRAIEKLTITIYQIFNEELNAVKKELSSKDVSWSLFFPKYAGSVFQARQLKFRVEKCMSVIERAYFLRRVTIEDEVIANYKTLVIALDEYCLRTLTEWLNNLNKEPAKLLDIRLLVRSNVIQPMIDQNFSKPVLKMVQEIFYWDRMKLDIPMYAMEIYAKWDSLRSLRENILQVVRSYNKIIKDLSIEERGLFKDKIRSLDKFVNPGLTKLMWSSRGSNEFFVSECLQQCICVRSVVDTYKRVNQDISLMCVNISELLLLKIDPRMIYDGLQFEEAQARHREVTLNKINNIYSSIISTLQMSYEMYKNDGQDVQQSWNQYTEKMDQMVEEAFRLNIKWSLQMLSRAINGDHKSTLNPIFKLKVMLGGDKPDFYPTIAQLARIVDDIGRMHLFNALAGFKHLPDLLTKKILATLNFSEKLAQDDDIKKIQSVINNGIQCNAQNLQGYLSTWDSYREIWEINKDAFIRRYQKLNPQNSSFDADIARYTEVANSVQMQESIMSIQFVLLDCTPLKLSLLSHCQEWQNKFTSLLSDIATTTLTELTDYLKVNAHKVSQIPKTLDELVETVHLWEKLSAEQASIEEKFAPLSEQFVILDKYEVVIPSKIRAMLRELPSEWDSFQMILEESESMLKKQKEVFRDGLLGEAEDLKWHIYELVKDFESTGPFTSIFGIEEALSAIHAVKSQTEILKEEEQRIRRGLSIFKIEEPSSKELANLEKDLESINTVWDLTKEWKKCWDSWKLNTFMGLETSVMEEISVSMLKQLTKFSKKLKDKGWEIVDRSKEKVDEFRRTMLLINDLKNHAMRARHWQQVQAEMNRSFDQTSEDFTLEKIIDYNFVMYSDHISEISQAATKELVIEQGLDAIKAEWELIELDLIPHKDKGHYKLRSADEIFQSLEDSQLQLMGMKGSRYVKPFEAEVDYWERTLSRILEMVEVMLAVQRQWLYLENIFLGDDIRKQLPKETASFDNINRSWKEIMTLLYTERYAKKGALIPGAYKQLCKMNEDLMLIQKSLEMYLETKRQIFPRFYFLSSDDLFDIFGQSRNPESIQPHLKKCFDSIKFLRIMKVGTHQQKFEAAGMVSPDGDFVEFGHPVLMEGPVENWLCEVEMSIGCPH